MSFHRTTILVVDDDTAARDAVAEIGRLAGFDVRVASNGAEALAAAVADDELDAIVCDLVMPQMDGLELANRVRECRPKVAILLMTGYQNRVDDVLRAGAVTLIKPFSAESFELAVRDAIDARVDE